MRRGGKATAFHRFVCLTSPWKKTETGAVVRGHGVWEGWDSGHLGTPSLDSVSQKAILLSFLIHSEGGRRGKDY